MLTVVPNPTYHSQRLSPHGCTPCCPHHALRTSNLPSQGTCAAVCRCPATVTIEGATDTQRSLLKTLQERHSRSQQGEMEMLWIDGGCCCSHLCTPRKSLPFLSAPSHPCHPGPLTSPLAETSGLAVGLPPLLTAAHTQAQCSLQNTPASWAPPVETPLGYGCPLGSPPAMHSRLLA